MSGFRELTLMSDYFEVIKKHFEVYINFHWLFNIQNIWYGIMEEL